jgi:hypothetical protein
MTGGERAKGGAGALEHEEGGERERDGRDQELDEDQVGDGVVDVRATGAEGDVHPVGEDLVENEQRSARLDRRAGLRRSGRGSCREAGGNTLEREARQESLCVGRGARTLDGDTGVAQPVAEVAVELGAVGEGDRGYDGGEHDREHGEGGEDDAGTERACLHRGSSR